jgi:hypothetical protein
LASKRCLHMGSCRTSWTRRMTVGASIEWFGSFCPSIQPLSLSSGGSADGLCCFHRKTDHMMIRKMKVATPELCYLHSNSLPQTWELRQQEIFLFVVPWHDILFALLFSWLILLSVGLVAFLWGWNLRFSCLEVCSIVDMHYVYC